MNDKLFLIDSNSLITPFRQYYAFGFAPTFWDKIKLHIENGNIAILDKVKAEILNGNDDLTKWMKCLQIKTYIKHTANSIPDKYSDVLEHIQNNPCYKPDALQEWSKNNIADAWLIATAAVHNYTIVTFEARNIGVNKFSPSSKAKIPDVASNFRIETVNLFEMMRRLKITL